MDCIYGFKRIWLGLDENITCFGCYESFLKDGILYKFLKEWEVITGWNEYEWWDE